MTLAALAGRRSAVGSPAAHLRPAVSAERAVLRRDARLAVRFVLVGREQGRIEEGHALVQHGDVARRADILRRDVRQPQQIVLERARAIDDRVVPQYRKGAPTSQRALAAASADPGIGVPLAICVRAFIRGSVACPH